MTDSRSKYWKLTIKYGLISLDEIRHLCDMHGWIFVGQHERGEQSTEKNPDGYDHWQLYIEDTRTEKGPRFTQLKKYWPQGAHIEMRGSMSVYQAVQYVTKDKTRVDGPYMNVESVTDFTGYQEPVDEPQHFKMTASEMKREAIREAVMGDGKTLEDIMNDSRLGLYAASCLPWLRLLIELRDASKAHERAVRVLWLEQQSGASVQLMDMAVRKLLERARSVWGEWGEWRLGQGYQPGVLPRTRAVLVDATYRENSGSLDDELFRIASGSAYQVPVRADRSFWAAWETVIVIATTAPPPLLYETGHVRVVLVPAGATLGDIDRLIDAEVNRRQEVINSQTGEITGGGAA